jgi:hypothetical protein
MPGRPLYLGEGLRDVGTPMEGRRRVVPCDVEGDLPRLIRRLAEILGAETRFGYDASTFRHVVARAGARDGRPTRVGGKAKDLRDAVFYSLTHSTPTPSAIFALIDATAAEFDQLRKDAADVIAQCREVRTDVPVVIGIALHEIEIWMLADEQARIAAFGAEVANSPLPGAGAEDIANPKHLWATYSGRSQPREGVALDLHRDEQRRAAWQALRTDVVGRLCPRGFAPFDADAQAALRLLLG